MAVILLVLLAPGCGLGSETPQTTVGRFDPGVESAGVDDITHVWPDLLPYGWKAGHAVERLEVMPYPGGKAIEVSDYSIVWRPERLAGGSREASTSHDHGPAIWLNSGSSFYEREWLELLGTSPTTLDVGAYDDGTPITVEEGTKTLTFRVGCCIARLSGRNVEERQLRQVAESLREMDRETWRERLGDRLLVDDSRVEDLVRMGEDR